MSKSFEMENGDYALIDSLLKVTKSIDKIYEVLYELEKNEEKDSVEYAKYLKYLNLALEVENNYYCEMSFEQLFRVYSFITTDLMPITYENNIESVISGVDTIRNVRRIITSFENIIDTNNYISFLEEEEFDELTEEDFDEFDELDELDELIEEFFQAPPQIIIEVFNCEDKEKIQEMLEMIINNQFDDFLNSEVNTLDYEMTEYDSFIQLFYSSQILNNYLIYIKNLQQEEQLKKHRNEFIKTKYDISFTNKVVESRLKENKFNVNDNDFNKGVNDVEFLGLKEDVYNLVFNEHMLREAILHIRELMKIKDNDYKDKKVEKSVLLRKALIKATLLNIDEECLTKISSSYIARLKKVKNIEEISISKSMIDSIFTVVNKDRQNCEQFVFKKS